MKDEDTIDLAEKRAVKKNKVVPNVSPGILALGKNGNSPSPLKAMME